METRNDTQFQIENAVNKPVRQHLFPREECQCGVRRMRAGKPKDRKPKPLNNPTMSRHHLFRRDEISEKLIEIMGKPLTQSDSDRLDREVEIAWNAMPIYTINHELHVEIHRTQLLRKTMPKK